jgi:hypothetical protein
MCGAPARNFAVLAAVRAEKQKGRGRGRPGIFIGEAGGQNGPVLNRELKRGNQSEGNGLRRDLRPEEEDDLALTGGSHQSGTRSGLS